ncbi:MAG: Gfo/Idh/MocA family oxidoreductase, partial [Planctomycetota bacterium]
MTRRIQPTRRDFLAAAGAAVAAPHLLPSGVLAAEGKAGANERLTVAHVGIGGMGGAHLKMSLNFRASGDVNIAAVCEADEGRLMGAVKQVGPGCNAYRDYRYVLERDDVDAVILATPDHWHAVQTVHACQSGKHVYVEKPASCTVAEGQAMVAAARKHDRVVQVGSQARSARPAHQACTYIRNGMLGTIKRVTTW